MKDHDSPEERLIAMARTAARLIVDSPTPPRRISLRSGSALLEVEWADLAGPRPPEPEANGVRPTATGVSEDPVAGKRNGRGSENGVEPAPHFVRAQMVGTFYRAAGPGSEPFVREGDRVSAGQQVAILEAMKMMMPVESDADGEVVRILTADAAGVEYDEPLIAIMPPKPA
jgi:acetyl-CoA carboxylase biotin carboxyl carrier protein